MVMKVLAAIALVFALLVPSAARANGRFPAAQHILVGPGRASTVIVVRATFGLVVSRDGGASFHWICEEALEYFGSWDPPIALSADGAVHAGLVDGLIQTRDGCNFTRNESVGPALVGDLANDIDGEDVLAVEAAGGVPNHVLISHDRGATFDRLGPGVAGGWFVTADAAPSRPSRVYATFMEERTRNYRLYRSDDGGATLSVTTTDFLGGSDAFLSAIDPTNPELIWVRSNAGTSTMLLRSDDGGATFTRAAQTSQSMLGFAISHDGTRVWYGGPEDGLFRSDDGGRTFARVSDLHVTCLRYHQGALYICADPFRDPYALGRWRDGEAAPEPLLRFADIAGPVECPSGTIVHDICGARWPSLRSTLVTSRDSDAGVSLDAAVRDSSARDTGAMDAPVDSGASRPARACGCATPGLAPGAHTLVAFASTLGALLAARRRLR